MTEYYKQMLEKGLQYQDFVTEQLYQCGLPLVAYSSKKYQAIVGENKNGIEIKFDDNIPKYGRIYIETAEKSYADRPEYFPSGIFRADNTWLYVIGNYQNIYIFSKNQLKILYQNIVQYKRHGILEKQTPTSQGFVIPLEYANKFLVLKHIEVLFNIQVC